MEPVQMERIIEQTADGSATLYVPALGEHYHSVKGALTESRHVFLQMGLEACGFSGMRILEVGLGTGLNAWLTLKTAASRSWQVHYTGMELYPLAWDEVQALHYADDDPLLKQIHTSPWHVDTAVTPSFVLHKMQVDACKAVSLLPSCSFHLVYMDAFAPDVQPALWSHDLLSGLYRVLSPGGILVTYCAKGCIRRMLQEIGFCVERLPGPPGGKREILRACKPAACP